MFVPKSVICILLVAVSFLTTSAGKCNFSDIFSHYNGILFQQLISLNLTRQYPFLNKNINLGNPCQSNKSYKLLQSIYKMTGLLKCQTKGSKENDVITNVHKIMNQIETMIRVHCKKIHQKQKKDHQCKPKRPRNKRRSNRKFIRKLNKSIEIIKLCWNKYASSLPAIY